MGRRSLKAIRSAEILECCEQIVLREGLAAATISRIGREVGLDRTTVHHHFGSQGLLHEAMIERIIDGYIAEAEKAISHAPQSIEQMVSMLFSDKFALPRFDRLLDEFETAARQDPKIASQVTRLYKTLEEQLVDFIVNSQADLPRAEARALGQSLYALLEGAYLLRSWGLPTSRLSVAREAAMRLVDHYKTTQSK